MYELYHLTFYREPTWPSSIKKKSNNYLSHLENFSRASYYQLALEQLHSCPEAPEALGTPLNIHYLQLSDKYHFVDIADVQVTRSPSELQAMKERRELP